MKTLTLIVVGIVALLTTVVHAEMASGSEKNAGQQANQADRWMEIDLYWFEKTNISKSVEVFWDRFVPLFDGAEGQKGVILNVGWLRDYVLDWRGEMNMPIPLPNKMHCKRYTDFTPLTGTTEERIVAWKKRFADVKDIPVEYEKWTYNDLKLLVESLRETASRRGLNNIRVGTYVLGWRSIYGGAPSLWVRKHPQAFTFDGKPSSFNVEAILDEDKNPYGAFPKGIPQGLPVYEFFAAQWGDLSKKLNLDAFVLRDSIVGMRVYSRNGPYGSTAPEDPAKVESHSRANFNLVKAVKMANPKVWLMGYSSAASAVADWRVNCFDLEAIAKSGYLDAFIEQTWSGAWNEVGQRGGRDNSAFWNRPILGWTPQLAYMLLHAAVLADTPTKHYTLAETFDAWEPWDVIHTAPDRLRWGIWAYLHAGVKTPKGLKFPSGTYISWANQEKSLLTSDDVKFLATNITEAAQDASRTKDVFGPTLVYNRSAMEWQSKNSPHLSIKEWIDEQAAVVMKNAAPILTVTRMEYLPKVKSDLFILQTPVHLQPTEKKAVIDLIQSGQPIAIWGSPAGGIDPEISALAGLTPKTDKDVSSHNKVHRLNANLIASNSALSEGIPAKFHLFQQSSANQATQGTEVIYEVNGSPALLLNLTGGKHLQVWDPCDFGPGGVALDVSIGSIYPYTLTARSLMTLLDKTQHLTANCESVTRPVTLHAWQLNDGSIRILAADTEEGLDHSAEMARSVTLTLPPSWPLSFTEIRKNSTVKAVDGKLRIELKKSEDRLFQSSSLPNSTKVEP